MAKEVEGNPRCSAHGGASSFPFTSTLGALCPFFNLPTFVCSKLYYSHTSHIPSGYLLDAPIFKTQILWEATTSRQAVQASEHTGN